jgi:hypothetical protein
MRFYASCCLDSSSQAGRIQRRDDAVHNPAGVELLSGSLPHTVAIHRAGLFNGLNEDCQRPLVFLRFHALPSWREPVYDDSGFASPYEGGSGPDAHGGAARQ